MWSRLLKDASSKRVDNLADRKRLLLLGDSYTGKTTLVASLTDSHAFPKCYGIEFRLMEIKDTFRGERTDLGIYVLDGDPVFLPMLRTSFTPANFQDFTVIITLDMSKPWSLIERLHFWLEKLEEFIESLQIPMEDITAYRNEVARRFMDFTEEDDFATDKKGDIMNTSITKKEPKELGPLPANTLTKNLGIPIIVVVSKTDVMPSLEKDYQLTDEHFDFIQMHIRRVCLAHGAGLIYSSIKENKNNLVFKSYIQHRIYGFQFTHRAYVVEKDCIFIPSGWDSEQKIANLESSLMKIKPTDAYSDVLPVPKPKNMQQQEPEIVAIEHQQFLAQLLSTMKREASTTPTNPESSMLSPGQGAPRNTPMKNPPAQARPRGSISTHSAQNRPGAVSSSGGGQPTNDRVLMNFFENLLNKSPMTQQNFSASTPIKTDSVSIASNPAAATKSESDPPADASANPNPSE